MGTHPQRFTVLKKRSFLPGTIHCTQTGGARAILETKEPPVTQTNPQMFSCQPVGPLAACAVVMFATVIVCCSSWVSHNTTPNPQLCKCTRNSWSEAGIRRRGRLVRLARSVAAPSRAPPAGDPPAAAAASGTAAVAPRGAGRSS